MAKHLKRQSHILHNTFGRVSLTRLIVLVSMVNFNFWCFALLTRTLLLDDMNFSMSLGSAAMILGSVGATASALHELTKWIEGRQGQDVPAPGPPSTTERNDQCD